MVFIESFHRRQVIVSIHFINLIHKVESQNIDRVENGTHDAIISITQNSCINVVKHLKASNENNFSIVITNSYK